MDNNILFVLILIFLGGMIALSVVRLILAWVKIDKYKPKQKLNK